MFAKKKNCTKSAKINTKRNIYVYLQYMESIYKYKEEWTITNLKIFRIKFYTYLSDQARPLEG